MERKENMAVFDVLKRQVSPKPKSNKRSNKDQIDDNKDLDNLDQIMIHK
jgi:hypothetical protein